MGRLEEGCCRRRRRRHIVVDHLQETEEPLHRDFGGCAERAQAGRAVLGGAFDELVQKPAEHIFIEQRAQVEMAASFDNEQHFAQAAQAPWPLVIAIGLFARAQQSAQRHQDGIAARL